MDLKTQLLSRISSPIDGFGLNTDEMPEFLERYGEEGLSFLDSFYLEKRIYKDVIFRTFPRQTNPSYKDQPMNIITYDEDFKYLNY